MQRLPFVRCVFVVGAVLLTRAGQSEAAPHPQLYKKWNFGHDVNDIVFSPNGGVMYVATSRGLFVKGTNTGKTFGQFWTPHGWSEFTQIALSPNMQFLAATAQKKDDYRLFVWSVKTKRLETVVDTSDAESMAFSPDSRWLAFPESLGDHRCMSLLDSHHWKGIRHLVWKGGLPPSSLAFSGDSKRLAGSAYYGDAGIGDLGVWSIPSGKLLLYQDGNMPEGPMYFLPDNKRLIFGPSLIPLTKRKTDDDFYPYIFKSDQDVHRWVALPYRGNVFVVKRWARVPGSYEGKEQLELWNVVRQKRLASWSVPFDDVLENTIEKSYICSPDNRWLAVWPGKQDEVRLYKIVSGTGAR